MRVSHLCTPVCTHIFSCQPFIVCCLAGSVYSLFGSQSDVIPGRLFLSCPGLTGLMPVQWYAMTQRKQLSICDSMLAMGHGVLNKS